MTPTLGAADLAAWRDARPMPNDDWYWDVDRQVAVRLDNAGRHDLLIGPYATQSDAEIWMPSSTWRDRPSPDADDEWADVNSSYD